MTDNETKVPDEKHRIRQWLDAVLLKSGIFYVIGNFVSIT